MDGQPGPWDGTGDTRIHFPGTDIMANDANTILKARPLKRRSTPRKAVIPAKAGIQTASMTGRKKESWIPDQVRDDAGPKGETP